MVAGCKVHRKVIVPLPHGAKVLPLRFSQFVVPAFYRVANVDDEIGVHEIDFAPDAPVDLRLGCAGAVADNGKAEIVFRLGERP